MKLCSLFHPKAESGGIFKLACHELKGIFLSLSQNTILNTIKAQQIYPEKQAMQGAAAQTSCLPQWSADLLSAGHRCRWGVPLPACLPWALKIVLELYHKIILLHTKMFTWKCVSLPTSVQCLLVKSSQKSQF